MPTQPQSVMFLALWCFLEIYSYDYYGNSSLPVSIFNKYIKSIMSHYKKVVLSQYSKLVHVFPNRLYFKSKH